MKKRKRYARAKPIKKENAETKIIKRNTVKALLIWGICEIILIILCLIIGIAYL